MPENSTEYGRHIVQYPNEVSVCVGCNACEIVCSLVHEKMSGQMLRRIFLDRDTINMDGHKIYACMHCADHPCYEACPKQDEALIIDENDIVYCDSEACIGCGLCVDACPFEPKRINFDKKTKKPKKCDLCRQRAQGPACVEFCQVRCIGLSDAPLPPAPPPPPGPPPAGE